jgi:hypothetical protein
VGVLVHLLGGLGPYVNLIPVGGLRHLGIGPLRCGVSVLGWKADLRDKSEKYRTNAHEGDIATVIAC